MSEAKHPDTSGHCGRQVNIKSNLDIKRVCVKRDIRKPKHNRSPEERTYLAKRMEARTRQGMRLATAMPAPNLGSKGKK
jgi:hypothetical protein